MESNEYWNVVLQEVLNKHNPESRFMYTAYGGFAQAQEPSVEYISHSRTKVSEFRKYYLGCSYPSVYFTQREYECIVALVRGETVKEIAANLRLSPRTVEYYIKNMKNKLGCSTRAQLIKEVMMTDLAKACLLNDETTET